jgi:hypothetical protein
MVGKERPTHRAYSVIRRDGEDDCWLSIGLVFPHEDGAGFNIVLQAYPNDGKIVCREIARREVVRHAPSEVGPKGCQSRLPRRGP